MAENDCNTCNGHGVVPNNGDFRDLVTCPDCGGTGKK